MIWFGSRGETPVNKTLNQASAGWELADATDVVKEKALSAEGPHSNSYDSCCIRSGTLLHRALN